MKNFFANQFSIFVLSLVLAFILWLTISGQDMSVHDLTVSLELVNLPANMALENDAPETVNLRVEANTAQFRFLENNKYYFRHDLGDVTPGENVFQVDWNALIPKLPRGVRVVRVYPEEIAFNVFPYVTKEIPVATETVGDLPEYLALTGDLIIEPNVAKVTGPENRLLGVNRVSLSPARLSEIRGPESSLTLTPQIAGLDNWLTIEPKVFRARAQVVLKEETAVFENEVILDTPIWNGPPVPLSFRPNQAKVKVSWTLDHPAPKAEDLKLVVRLSREDLESPGNLRLPISPLAPNWVKIVSVEPSHLVITKVRRPDILKP
ncbi:MAG: hypothetical protein LBI10_03300 [Deltaproteobacteria bacterium]|jgi:methionine-rich copper-binding protein CopC|nr:hypothetical protein [Deltaproteobacteria bacterium]